VRKETIPSTQSENTLYTLGWDAAGEVIAAGSDCTLFGEGDSVYHTGSISRPGTDSEFHLIDECIVERKPKSQLLTI
jgi:NADPH:quinone reductase